MFNRAANARVPVTRDVRFPAPTKGWVQSGNITTAGRDQAEVLDNFFCTAQGARLRGGSAVYANLGAAVKRLLVYSGTADDLFGATAAGIFDADRINGGGSNFADVAGMTSGDWSATQISTAGGSFLVAVNGSDPAMTYNGSVFNPVKAVATNTISYTARAGAATANITVTGGTSGATATILAFMQTSATAGALRLGAITGAFLNGETLTWAGGSATSSSLATVASSIAITGVLTTALSQVWSHKQRLFFVQKDTMSAWYLPSASIGGAASELPLGSVFRRGGSLLFGASWSLDSGAGLDDVAVFVTTNGEIAVYQGDDPSSATDWVLSGVYEISRPLNKHSFFKAGGDLAILTEDGIIPVSEALRKDRAALQAVAISYPIEDAWKTNVAGSAASFSVSATLWQSQALLMIGVQGAGGVAYVANARTGAWSRYIGWDVRCGGVANDRLYFGTNAGAVMRGQTGGDDDGTSYTGYYVPKFTAAGNAGVKVANFAGVTVKAIDRPTFRMTCFADYAIGTYPTPTPIAALTGDVWGSGVWGTFVWGTGAPENTYTIWKTVIASGNALAPAVVVMSNQTAIPSFEILALTLRFENANVF